MKTADEIAATAVTLGTAEREAFLDRACAGDAALRRRVETLLKVEAETLLAHPRQIGEAEGGEAIGTLIGPYKLLRSIGEGGMGMVWIAEQASPCAAAVALKIIKPGMDSGEVIARFEAERQALAMMDHPNIAKVLDAGTTDTGRPYFVMELVPGRSDHPILRRASAWVRASGWSCSCRSAAPSSTRTRRASSTATSSPRTCWSSTPRRQAGAEGDRLRHRQGHGTSG